jgi:hypothetical protein
MMTLTPAFLCMCLCSPNTVETSIQGEIRELRSLLTRLSHAVGHDSDGNESVTTAPVTPAPVVEEKATGRRRHA